MILTEASKESIWLKGLISNLGFPQDKVVICWDNMNAICLANDQVHNERSKHIDIRYHFICIEKRIAIQKVYSKENPPNMFTRPVPRSKFMHHLDILNVERWE